MARNRKIGVLEVACINDKGSPYGEPLLLIGGTTNVPATGSGTKKYV